MTQKLFTIFAFLLFSFSSIAQQYEVESSRKTFRDSDRRNRRVNVRMYYPGGQTADATFPVVVLGHGFVMGSDAYRNIYNDLVPNGYIVAFVDTEGSFFANHRAYAEDIAFVAEAMQAENNNSSSPVFGMVADKTALMGHSMGGGAATVAASLVDVETLIVMAPALLRFDTLTPATQVTMPSLVFSGSGDAVTPPDENHIPVYQNLGSDCKYFINILGGAHCYYANSNWACDFGERTSRGNITISRTQHQQIVSRYVNSWLDYQLKGDMNAKQAFDNDLSSSDIDFENGCGARANNVVDTTESIEAKITPNPATSMISIQTTGKAPVAKVEFFNQFGQMVQATKSLQTNVSKFLPGPYVVRIHTGNSVITKKLIVK